MHKDLAKKVLEEISKMVKAPVHGSTHGLIKIHLSNHSYFQIKITRKEQCTCNINYFGMLYPERFVWLI